MPNKRASRVSVMHQIWAADFVTTPAARRSTGSGSDATFFEYFKGEGPKPSRTQEGMILSASEWTGVPLAAVLHEAGLTAKSLYVRAEGNDLGVPPTAAEGTKPFYYDKGLPIEKALHPDTILAWAQNGQLLEHLHGAPVRLLVPGWSGNWSVKWLIS